jgi:hypothetical protein
LRYTADEKAEGGNMHANGVDRFDANKPRSTDAGNGGGRWRSAKAELHMTIDQFTGRWPAYNLNPP